MTPCIKLLKKKKVPYTLHKYNHNRAALLHHFYEPFPVVEHYESL